VSAIDAKQVVGERSSVGEVSVVHKHNAVRRVHVERLCLFFVLSGARSGVANVTEAELSGEGPHVTCAKRLAHLALGLELVQVTAIGCGDTRGILPSVLEQKQGVVDLLVHRFG
jgi:hypothetical protein